MLFSALSWQYSAKVKYRAQHYKVQKLCEWNGRFEVPVVAIAFQIENNGSQKPISIGWRVSNFQKKLKSVPTPTFQIHGLNFIYLIHLSEFAMVI